MIRSAPLALCLFALVIAGCGGSSSSSSGLGSGTATSSAPASSSSGGGAAGMVQATMKNLAFVPTSITAKVGQAVTWTNDDTAPHNVTYVSGPKFTSSGTLNTGGTFQLKVTTPGTIHYFCSIHPFMKATVVVTQ